MYKLLKICILYLFFSVGLASCSPKVGCPAREDMHAAVNRKGVLKETRAKSSLLSPREMRRVRNR